MNNRITIFSNGIADFIRNYQIEKGKTEKISLSVKRDHVADVLASLNIFGSVKLVSPPSFRTLDGRDKSLTLDPKNILLEIATKLSGSKVSFTKLGETAQEGILYGVHKEGSKEYETTCLVIQVVNKPVQVKQADGSWLPLSNDMQPIQLQLVEINDITDFKFVDPLINVEIDKAIASNLQKVKPDSTFIDLSILGTEKSNVALQYTVPAAAWKISYRLNYHDIVAFKGLAIVDNNTEEDWEDVIVSVVTGEPITFRTDLAESKIPSRNYVSVVKDRAEGAVDAGFESVPSAISVNFAGASPPSRHAKAFAASASINPSVCMESADFGGSAIEAETDIKEVGDFSIFEAKDPVSIASNNSAIIPVFDAILKEAKTVLHYKQSNHQTRSYRSIQFKNETEHSLSRGVCTVNIQGLYAGSCIVPAMKQGQEQLLPYALETGVKVSTKQNQGDYRIGQVASKGGSLYIEQIQKIETTYSIANFKKEDFEFYLDYSALTNSDVISCKLNGEGIVGKTSDSVVRYDFNLPANSSVTAIITETVVQSSSLQINEDNYDWFYSTYIANNGSLSQIENLQPLIKMCDHINGYDHEIEICETKIEKLMKKQDRLRSNIVASGERDEITIGWRKELVENEKVLTQLEDTELPDLEDKKLALQKKISKTLKDISFELKM